MHIVQARILADISHIALFENWRFSSTFSQDEVAWFQVIISKFTLIKIGNTFSYSAFILFKLGTL